MLAIYARERSDVEGGIKTVGVTSVYANVSHELTVTQMWVLDAKLRKLDGSDACSCASCGCTCFKALDGSTPLNPQILDFWVVRCLRPEQHSLDRSTVPITFD